MKIDVFFSVAEVDPLRVVDRTAVVIDVIRATTTITEAIANGARGVFPTVSAEDALKLASSLGRDGTLLCGERKGLKVEGFDLGNSPGEFGRAVVADKQLVMSTTNGTRAFQAASSAARVLAASFLNLSAVVRALQEDGDDIVVICAGKEDRFSLDDALCAGYIVRRLAEAGDTDLECNDGADAALTLGREIEVSEAVLRNTAAGQALVEVGLDGDLAVCASLDRYSLVPEMVDQMIQVLRKVKTRSG